MRVYGPEQVSPQDMAAMMGWDAPVLPYEQGLLRLLTMPARDQIAEGIHARWTKYRQVQLDHRRRMQVLFGPVMAETWAQFLMAAYLQGQLRRWLPSDEAARWADDGGPEPDWDATQPSVIVMGCDVSASGIHVVAGHVRPGVKPCGAKTRGAP